MVSNQSDLTQFLSNYSQATNVLVRHLDSPAFLGLLRGTLNAGLLDSLRQPKTVNTLAQTFRRETLRIAALCNALNAYGVLVREGEAYRLDDQWAILLQPDALFLLGTTIDFALARMEVFELAATKDYWSLPSQTRIAIAKGITANSASPFAIPLMQTIYAASNIEIYERLMTGGRYLELGCGIAGGMLGMLRAFPSATAVGIDKADDVLAEAQRQAAQLGLLDRARFVQGDTQDFDEPESFDVAVWSQFFFAEATRAGTLKRARQALKPGGWLVATLLGEPPASEALHTDEGRDFAMYQVMYSSWDIPIRTSEALQAEIQTAGFEDAQVVQTQTPMGKLVVARRPSV